MERNELVVRKDGHAEVATVEETVETTSTTYARVEGESLSGWVEVPDNPASPSYVAICDDCGHMEEHPETSQEVLVDAKHNVCNHEGSANVLRDIHEAKRPTHSPRVEVTA